MPKKRTMICRICGRDFLTRNDRPASNCSIRCSKTKPRDPALIDPDGITARIPLRAHDDSIRAYALIDATDAPWASQWRWHLAHGYAVRSEWVDGKMQVTPLHRALLGLIHSDGFDGDHINRDRLDDHRSNLRILPKGGNGQNQPSEAGSSSQYRGVSWMKAAGKWMAYVRVNDKLLHLGFFTVEQEAAAVAKAARLRLLPYAVD